LADLANLRISVDSREVKTATSDLNSLSGASGRAETSIGKMSSAAKLFGGVLAAAGVLTLATNVAKATAEFQSLSASLKVATGSSAAASAAFSEIQKFAAETPYQLNQSVEAFLRLKNLGLDPSMNSLRSYGNTAASMGKDLMQMVEAVADASTGEFERLKEFGIKAKKQKDEVTFTFQGVSTTVKDTSEQIQKYLLDIGNTQFAGAMTEQMNTLNGRMSNLQDNIDNFYRTIGNLGAANIFTVALNAASNAVVFLTDNLKTILYALELVLVALAGVAAAFVAFKAVLGVQFVVAYIGQLIAMQFALGATTTATALAGAGIKGLQAILAGTGWGLAVVAIGAVVGAIYALATAQSRARAETNATIASLKTLAQAKSVGFEQARTNAEIEKRLLERDIKVIRDRNKAQAVGQGKKIEYVTPDLASKRERLDALNIGIREADTLRAQADAMSAITVPAAAAAAGIEKTGSAAKAAEDPLKKYRDALADMVEEGKKIGMTPEAVKKFEVEKLAVAAATAGYKDYNKIKEQGMINAFRELGVDIAAKLKEETKARNDASKTHKETITTLQGELSLIGLVGVEREKGTLALEKEAYVLKFGAAAWEEYHAARIANINAKSVLDKDVKAAEALVNNLETAAGMIGGKAGKTLQGILKTEITLKDGETKKISEAIAASFPKLGAALSAAMAGAQIGTTVDSVFKAVGVKSSKAGAQVGGAIGMAAFGPIGAVAGSILGGIVGGMLKKVKTGSVTLSQIAGGVMERTLTGNSARLKGIADKMATGLLSGLGDIAEQLGGTLGGNVKVSLGQRKKDFVVDPTGMGRTKGSGVMNFGEDQAAAVAYVTQLAIQQGIITGISAGAQALIKAGNDLNAQVAKALKFDQVFKDLKKESDPLGASLDELSAEMLKLKAIFDEAGASAADYAKLQELYAIKQAKAIFEANKPRRELEIQLMEAQGDAVGALAAQRALELESMDAGLRGLQLQIYAAQDAAKATEQIAEAAQEAANVQKEAQDTLRSAYERESIVLEETAQKFRELGDSLRQVSKDINVMIVGSDSVSGELRSRFFSTSASARLGNEQALGDLPNLATQYADLVVDTAPDRLSMIRELSAIQAETDASAIVADRQASIAELQLTALEKQVSSLISIEETAISVATALRQLVSLSGGIPAPTTSSAISTPSTIYDSNQVSTFGTNDNVTSQVSALRDEMKVAMFQIAKNTSNTATQLQRWDGDGLPEARDYA
jgi:hypothetical protein